MAGDKSNTSGANDISGDQAVQASPTVAPKLKEQAPVQSDKKIAGIDMAESDRVAKEEGDEYWENYAREIELEKEILEMGGVEKVEEGEVKVPEELAKEMGIHTPVTIQTPMQQVTGFSVRGVVLDDSQLGAGLAKPTSSGLRWLVEWFIYQLLKAHFYIKKISGRVVRQKSS